MTTRSDIYEFYQEWNEGLYEKKILIEGDSWVSHPLVLNISEQIDSFGAKDNLILNIGSPGDAADQIFKPNGSQYKKLQRLISTENWGEKFDLIFLSAAGNDIIGDEIWKNGYVFNKKDFPDKYGEELISHHFYNKVNEIVQGYSQFLTFKNSTRNVSTPVITHSYCYLKPRKVGTHFGSIKFNEGWACIHFEHQNITNPDEQYAIICKMLDFFYNEIKKLEATYNNFMIVDTRKVLLGADEKPDLSLWHDEIHPNNAGFKKVTEYIRKEVKSHGLWTL